MEINYYDEKVIQNVIRENMIEWIFVLCKNEKRFVRNNLIQKKIKEIGIFTFLEVNMCISVVID